MCVCVCETEEERLECMGANGQQGDLCSVCVCCVCGVCVLTLCWVFNQGKLVPLIEHLDNGELVSPKQHCCSSGL